MLALGVAVTVVPALALQIDVAPAGFDTTEARVIDAAAAVWERAITSAGRFAAEIRKTDLEPGTAGLASDFTEDASGVPSGGTIAIAQDIAWYVDPTPEDAGEFHLGPAPFHFVSDPSGPAFGRFDLLTVVVHELGHALGFTTSSSRFADRVSPGSGAERLYVGTGITAALTPAGLGTHLDPAFHRPDLMNPVLASGNRLLPSVLDLRVLEDAFGYSIALPPTPVPQPPPMACMLVAVIVVVLFRRHRPSRGGELAQPRPLRIATGQSGAGVPADEPKHEGRVTD
jgi:hypothetical protein